jgi:hypothetical protein
VQEKWLGGECACDVRWNCGADAGEAMQRLWAEKKEKRKPQQGNDEQSSQTLDHALGNLRPSEAGLCGAASPAAH